VIGLAYVPPKWRKPAPLGYGNAIDSVGAVGSSLLAGFSLASVIVVTSEAGKFRWPGAAILALTTAAVLLIAAVQCTYNTRPRGPHLPAVPDRGIGNRPARRDGEGDREIHRRGLAAGAPGGREADDGPPAETWPDSSSDVWPGKPV
jgi:hypothetical protein